MIDSNSLNILDKPNTNTKEVLQQKHSELKKAAKAVEKDCKKVMNEMSEDEWNKENKSIIKNIKNLEKLKKEIEYILESEYMENNIEMEKNIETIKEYLLTVEKDTIPLINKIKEKVKNFENNFDNYESNEIEIESEDNNKISLNSNNIEYKTPLQKNNPENNNIYIKEEKRNDDEKLILGNIQTKELAYDNNLIKMKKTNFYLLLIISFVSGFIISLIFTELVFD